MAPRAITPRKLSNPPEIKGYKPFGLNAGKQKKASVKLLLEEYEALKLSDFDLYNHQQASELMEVSRPTFTRIYAEALKKIAKAFVEGRSIIIEGGHVYFDSNWHHCSKCKSYFNDTEGKVDEKITCPLCKSDDTVRVEHIPVSARDEKGLFQASYACKKCNIEQTVSLSEAQEEILCPFCYEPMRRNINLICDNFNQCLE